VGEGEREKRGTASWFEHVQHDQGESYAGTRSRQPPPRRLKLIAYQGVCKCVVPRAAP
jgi:hypothetical protein